MQNPRIKCLTSCQVFSELSKRYRLNLSQGMKILFDKLHQEYSVFCMTRDLDTLRYLLALCLRAHHGRRMPWKSTRVAVDCLIANNISSHTFNCFADLYETIGKLLQNIPFARGPLTIYDTALNIGQLLTPTVEPDNEVYLNAGAWEGAVFIKGRPNVKHIMSVSDWQTSNLFSGLDSKTIEDVLCIYKDVFKKLYDGQCVTSNDLDVVVPSCISRRPHRFQSKSEVLKKWVINAPLCFYINCS